MPGTDSASLSKRAGALTPKLASGPSSTSRLPAMPSFTTAVLKPFDVFASRRISSLGQLWSASMVQLGVERNSSTMRPVRKPAPSIMSETSAYVASCLQELTVRHIASAGCDPSIHLRKIHASVQTTGVRIEGLGVGAPRMQARWPPCCGSSRRAELTPFVPSSIFRNRSEFRHL